MAKCIMIQGTMSGAGKSLLVAGLCRVFSRDGYRVAPFKSQNMALNSYITKDGCEIGRAQAVQAMACGVQPDVRMNPVLLKPTTDMGSQVIVLGKVQDQLSAKDYYARKKELIPTVKQAYDSLAEEYDIIVIEGAGSPAEINLMKDDFVNMGLAKMVDAPVLLVGDIDRGGVFAQLYGTVSLLPSEDADRIKGLIINKFRGDVDILRPGLKQLEDICKKKVVGVVPYTKAEIEEEDSISDRLSNRKVIERDKAIRIAVIRLPRISNYTDFQPLEMEPDVELTYVSKKEELKDPDLIIIPGTKSTMEDLKWMRQSGLEGGILRMAAKGTPVVGICGGFQMLGRMITDPQGSEGGMGESIRGMELLGMDTEFRTEKNQRQVEHVIPGVTGMWEKLSGQRVLGYEIHMGQSLCNKEEVPGILCNDRVMGTYIHGIFENGGFRTAFLECIAKNKGIERSGFAEVDYDIYREKQFDLLAEDIRSGLDMEAVYSILGLGEKELSKEPDHGDQTQITFVKPSEIEGRSMEIIDSILREQGTDLSGFKENEIPVLKRAIHTSADFEYVKNLIFSENAVDKMKQLILDGCDIVTDTQMAKSGINKKELQKYGCTVHCFMSDEDVAQEAKERGVTRATVSMERAMNLGKPLIFAIGNAPTALIELDRLLKDHASVIQGIIGVPVGFVNVVEAKELILADPVASIVARGRKGGSNLAAAIVNAILYELRDE